MCDVNARNCLGCTPLLYACGSGHVGTVRALLSHPEVDVNRRNNDRLTSFMLAMQVAPSYLYYTLSILYKGYMNFKTRGIPFYFHNLDSFYPLILKKFL